MVTMTLMLLVAFHNGLLMLKCNLAVVTYTFRILISLIDDNTTGAANTDSDTMTIMYGMYLDTDWEVYGRWIDSDGSAAGPLNGSIMSIGLNNYMAGQNAKWTTEITWNDSNGCC